MASQQSNEWANGFATIQRTQFRESPAGDSADVYCFAIIQRMGEWLRNNPTNNPTNTISRVSRRGLSEWEWLRDKPMNGRMALQQSNEQSNEHNFAGILKGTQRMCMASE